MTDNAPLPLLFLDVDGPLVPFGTDAPREPADEAPDEHLARLNPTVGRRLAALPCELIWASTWEDEANAEVAPCLGLPRLPVVRWPEPTADDERVDQWFGRHWKTRALVERAKGRAFAWIDDEITDADRDWVSTQYSARTLLHRVDPSRGLAGEDFAALDAWLRAT